MIETYEILSRVYDKQVGPKPPKGTSATKGHYKTIFKRGYRLTSRSSSSQSEWPQYGMGCQKKIVNAKNTQALKNMLDKHWRIHPSKYNYLHNP